MSKYVDQTSGLDSNAGTFAAPWKTLAKVAASSISGEAVYLKRGEFWLEGLVVPVGVIKVGAYGVGSDPIIDGNSGVTACIDLDNVDGVILENLELRRADYGVRVAGASVNDIVLRNIRVSNHDVSGYLFATTAQGAVAPVMDNCTAFHSDVGLTVGSDNDVIVRGGRFYENSSKTSAVGIRTTGTGRVQCYDVEIAQNYTGLSEEGTGTSTFNRCWIHDNLEDQTYGVNGGLSIFRNCIITSPQTDLASTNLSHLDTGRIGRYYNCVFDIRNVRPVTVVGVRAEAGTDLTIVNCAFRCGPVAGNYFIDAASSGGAGVIRLIENNAYDNLGVTRWVVGVTTYTSLTAWQAVTDMATDPVDALAVEGHLGLVGDPEGNPLDAAPTASSIVRDAGQNLYATQMVDDFSRRFRPSSGPWDIGAFEFVEHTDFDPALVLSSDPHVRAVNSYAAILAYVENRLLASEWTTFRASLLDAGIPINPTLVTEFPNPWNLVHALQAMAFNFVASGGRYINPYPIAEAGQSVASLNVVGTLTVTGGDLSISGVVSLGALSTTAGDLAIGGDLTVTGALTMDAASSVFVVNSSNAVRVGSPTGGDITNGIAVEGFVGCAYLRLLTTVEIGAASAGDLFENADGDLFYKNQDSRVIPLNRPTHDTGWIGANSIPVPSLVPDIYIDGSPQLPLTVAAMPGEPGGPTRITVWVRIEKDLVDGVSPADSGDYYYYLVQGSDRDSNTLTGVDVQFDSISGNVTIIPGDPLLAGTAFNKDTLPEPEIRVLIWGR